MTLREKLLSRLARINVSRKYVDLAVIVSLVFDTFKPVFVIVTIVFCLFMLWSHFPFGFSFFKVEEQQKKALEEDPSVFDYDGVYDQMKEKVARPLVQDREERKVWLQFE